MLKPTPAIASASEIASGTACHQTVAPQTSAVYEPPSQIIKIAVLRCNVQQPWRERPVLSKWLATRASRSRRKAVHGGEGGGAGAQGTISNIGDAGFVGDPLKMKLEVWTDLIGPRSGSRDPASWSPPGRPGSWRR